VPCWHWHPSLGVLLRLAFEPFWVVMSGVDLYVQKPLMTGRKGAGKTGTMEQEINGFFDSSAIVNTTRRQRVRRM
jgi:hypothetical protein